MFPLSTFLPRVLASLPYLLFTTSSLEQSAEFCPGLLWSASPAPITLPSPTPPSSSWHPQWHPVPGTPEPPRASQTCCVGQSSSEIQSHRSALSTTQRTHGCSTVETRSLPQCCTDILLILWPLLKTLASPVNTKCRDVLKAEGGRSLWVNWPTGTRWTSAPLCPALCISGLCFQAAQGSDGKCKLSSKLWN